MLKSSSLFVGIKSHNIELNLPSSKLHVGELLRTERDSDKRYCAHSFLVTRGFRNIFRQCSLTDDWKLLYKGLAIGALFCIFIFFLSLNYGTKNVTRFDTVLLAGAFLAIIVWVFTKNALYSVILVSAIDFSGYLPTARKGHQEPNTETISLYVMNAMTDILGLMALSTYSVTTVLYLATLLFANSSLVILLFLRRRQVLAME